MNTILACNYSIVNFLYTHFQTFNENVNKDKYFDNPYFVAWHLESDEEMNQPFTGIETHYVSFSRLYCMMRNKL